MSAAEIVAAVTPPLEVDLGGGRVVTVDGLSEAGGVLRASVSVRQDAQERPFCNPWLIVNPPSHVRVDGAAVHDPQAALGEMIRHSGFFHG
jgi:hypothetical protein